MNRNEARLLAALAEAEGYAVNVGRRARVGNGSLSQVLGRLEQAGLVVDEERIPRPGLKPRRWYRLTDAGRVALAAAGPSPAQRAEERLERAQAAAVRVDEALAWGGDFAAAWAEVRRALFS